MNRSASGLIYCFETIHFQKRDKDMSKLKGKVAVVTGASKGIGAAIAKSLAGEGASSSSTTPPARPAPTPWSAPSPLPAAKLSPSLAMSPRPWRHRA